MRFDILAAMVLDDLAMNYDLESAFPTLRNAPITEALIDIRAALLPDVDLPALRKFYDGLEVRFPKIDERASYEATVEFKLAGAEMKGGHPKPDGFILRSEKEALVVQARLDGFTIHKLSPYLSWRALGEQAKELWERYVRAARPGKVTRLAVRYTNRIELLPGHNFKEFILTAPEIAPGLPQGVPEYLMRLVIPHPSGSTAIVTETSLPMTPDAETCSMILDIDVFREVDIQATDDGSIWSTMEELRAYKNLIFFRTITPAQLEKYK